METTALIPDNVYKLILIPIRFIIPAKNTQQHIIVIPVIISHTVPFCRATFFGTSISNTYSIKIVIKNIKNSAILTYLYLFYTAFIINGFMMIVNIGFLKMGKIKAPITIIPVTAYDNESNHYATI